MKKNTFFFHIVLLIGIAILFSSNKSFSQVNTNKFSTKEDEKTKKINDIIHIIYTFGAHEIHLNACIVELQEKYGFKTKHKTDAAEKHYKKLIHHNEEIEKKLNERNGKFWHINYEKEKKKCNTEEDNSSGWDLESDD